jgi:A/G-specific adenine glycosylase
MSTPFSELLIHWFSKNYRELPWRNSKKPYYIWLSEILLQQTRVAQGTPYFHRFIAAFPTIQDLANAPEEQVFKLWQGLGYYNRARNLHAAAKKIAHQGFPTSYQAWLALPGVGPYTAAAVASIYLNEHVPAIDGNVLRVIARFMAIPYEVNQAEGYKAVSLALGTHFKTNQPGTLNEAMMELGATVCTPKKPQCHICPLQTLCACGTPEKAADYPRKKPKKKPIDRYLIRYFFYTENESLWLRRAKGDIWAGLYDLPGQDIPDLNAFQHHNLEKEPFVHLISGDLLSKPEEIKHQLTHQTLFIRLYKIKLPQPSPLPWGQWMEHHELHTLALPRPFAKWLEEHPTLIGE